jgi:hypothetical protein
MILKINVTQEDIDDGTPNNCASCPVALATNRALAALGFPNPAARVGTSYIFAELTGIATHESRFTWWFNPYNELGEFISRVDEPGVEVEPEKFTLEIPELDQYMHLAKPA